MEQSFWEKASEETSEKLQAILSGFNISNSEKIKLYVIAWEQLKTQLEKEKPERTVNATYLWESFINILRILVRGMFEK